MSVDHRLAYPSPHTVPHNARPHDHPGDLPGPARRDRPLPKDMYQRRQWVAWRYLPPQKAGDKPRKVPYTPGTRREAKSNTPATWGTYADARADVAAGRADGIGFVLSADDPFFCIDLDSCRDPETGAIDPWAQTILDRFGTYVEPSPSGTGIHIVGYGKKPGTNCKRGTQIECYDHLRFLTITEQGTAPVRDCQDMLNAWYGETWPEKEQPARPQPTWSGVGLTNEQILEKAFRARNGEKIRRLYEGDTSGYPPSQSDSRFSSEADQALVNYLCGYTDDDDQLADLWRSSGLYRRKLDRTDYVERTIQQARKGQSWAYDPTYGTTPKLTVVPNTPPPDDAGPEPRSNAELRAIIAERDATITEKDRLLAQKDAHIVRLQDRVQIAEEKAQRLSFERSQVMQVLRATDLHAGEKLTHFVQTIDLGARIANGEEPTPAGFRSPAARIAEMTGQPVGTVQRHRRLMHARGIIQKKNVREETEKDQIDPETGEILTETGSRDVTYIRVPDNNIINLIAPAVAYSRPEDAPQRGGKREPRCSKHPNASTTTTHNTTCDECGAVVDEYETHHHPEPVDESSGSKLEPETNVVNTVLRGSKLEPETSHANFEPETRPFAVPDDFWDDPGPGNVAARAAFYRGEAVS